MVTLKKLSVLRFHALGNDPISEMKLMADFGSSYTLYELDNLEWVVKQFSSKLHSNYYTNLVDSGSSLRVAMVISPNDLKHTGTYLLVRKYFSGADIKLVFKDSNSIYTNNDKESVKEILNLTKFRK